MTSAKRRTQIEHFNTGDKFGQPRHMVVQLTTGGLFRCSAYGPGRYTLDTLKAWATEIGAELVVITWLPEAKQTETTRG